jgi:hypothetical protein
MVHWKELARTGLLALLMGAGLVLVAGTAAPANASATWSGTRSTAAGQDVIGPSAGDPDGPTGDLPPPGTSPSGSYGGTVGGTEVSRHQQGATLISVTPDKRGGVWAHWMNALRMGFRLALVVR